MAKGLFPLRGHPDQALFDELRGTEVTVEHLHARDSRALHPFQVCGNALLGDIAIHPVPPGARLSGVRRILEAAQKRIIIHVLRENPRGQEESANQDRAHPYGQTLSHEGVSHKVRFIAKTAVDGHTPQNRCQSSKKESSAFRSEKKMGTALEM